MRYEDLKRPPATKEIDLGRGRTAKARMIGTTELHAIARACPQPDAPVVGTDPISGAAVRDDECAAHDRAMDEWRSRIAAVTVAVATGYTASGNLEWDPTTLIDPAPGSKLAADTAEGQRYTRAEDQRKRYARAAVREFNGDGKTEALCSYDELTAAYRAVKTIGLADEIAGSAEGNSGTGADPDPDETADADAA